MIYFPLVLAGLVWLPNHVWGTGLDGLRPNTVEATQVPFKEIERLLLEVRGHLRQKQRDSFEIFDRIPPWSCQAGIVCHLPEFNSIEVCLRPVEAALAEHEVATGGLVPPFQARDDLKVPLAVAIDAVRQVRAVLDQVTDWLKLKWTDLREKCSIGMRSKMANSTAPYQWPIKPSGTCNGLGAQPPPKAGRLQRLVVQPRAKPNLRADKLRDASLPLDDPLAEWAIASGHIATCKKSRGALADHGLFVVGEGRLKSPDDPIIRADPHQFSCARASNPSAPIIQQTLDEEPDTVGGQAAVRLADRTCQRVQSGATDLLVPVLRGIPESLFDAVVVRGVVED